MTAKLDAVGAGGDADGSGQGGGVNSRSAPHRGGKAGKRRVPSRIELTRSAGEELAQVSLRIHWIGESIESSGKITEEQNDALWTLGFGVRALSSCLQQLLDGNVEGALRFWRSREGG